MYVALYSGKNRLEQLVTSEKPITSVIEWNETLTFKLDIADLPRFVFVTSIMGRVKGPGVFFFVFSASVLPLTSSRNGSNDFATLLLILESLFIIHFLIRNAKLCFSIQKRRKTDDSKKKNKTSSSDEPTIVKSANLYWINMTVFDFKGTLRQGMWINCTFNLIKERQEVQFIY